MKPRHYSPFISALRLGNPFGCIPRPILAGRAAGAGPAASPCSSPCR